MKYTWLVVHQVFNELPPFISTLKSNDVDKTWKNGCCDLDIIPDLYVTSENNYNEMSGTEPFKFTNF